MKYLYENFAALKLLGGLQHLGYSKLLRLSPNNEAALGKLITFFTVDHERIQQACLNAPAIIATPIMFLLSLVYTVYIAGFPSILGFVCLIISYPVLVKFFLTKIYVEY